MAHCITNVNINNKSYIYSFIPGDATARFDNVFWFGDLNFRLEKGRHTVEYLVNAITEQEHPNFEDLLLGDELGQCIYQGWLRNLGFKSNDY